MVSPDQILRHNLAVHVETFEHESVVFVRGVNTLHHLNETATVIWTLADGRSLAQIVDILITRFSIAADQVTAPTRELVEVLIETGLVTTKQQPSGERENLVKEA